MRRTILLVSLMALAMLLLASGVALAKYIGGTDGDDNLRGTKRADTINSYRGNDVVKGRKGNDTLNGNPGEDRVYGGQGNDKIFGGDGKDQEYGSKGRDRISSAGLEADVVDCGPGGRDWAEVDPLDTVVNCERVEMVTPTP
jgi:RTX calcium-binding nonapeptide repeat (4 copies)